MTAQTGEQSDGALLSSSRRRLLQMAERTIAHNKAGTTHLTESTSTIPVSNSYDRC